MGPTGGSACGESDRNALWGMADACLALARAKLLMKAEHQLWLWKSSKVPELAICCTTPLNTPEFVGVCGAVVDMIHAESVHKYLGRNQETYGVYPSPARCLE